MGLSVEILVISLLNSRQTFSAPTISSFSRFHSEGCSMKGFDWLSPKPPWLPTSSLNAASSFLWYIGFIGYNKVDGFAEVFFWARYFCSCSVSSDLPFHEAYDSDYLSLI